MADGRSASSRAEDVAEVVGRTLVAHGADHVFGVVGSGNFHVTNAMVAAGARFVAAAHENGAALMVATHELEFVQRVSRCIALRDGELAYDGGTTGIDVLALVS